MLVFFNGQADEKPKDILKSISKHSIDIGTGKTNDVYIFVDPKCKYSKKLITKITKNKMLQLINTYHIYLYNLPRLKSEKLTHYIYNSKESKKVLTEVMVEGKEMDLSSYKTDENISEMIDQIREVAESFEIKKRPYMIVFESTTGYCRVSEGSATCVEEMNFE